MKRIANFTVLIFFILLLIQTTALAQHKKKAPFDPQLITVIKGNVPLLITVSHGGSQKLGKVPERTGEGKKQFHKLKDSYTLELSASVMKALDKKKVKPYIIIAQVHRKYVDLNRDEKNGTEHNIALAYHRSFHQQIHGLIKEIHNKHGQVFLMDVHGQAKYPDLLIRGTKQGKLIQPLLKKHGWKSIDGPLGIMGGLKERNYKVSPTTPKGKEAYSGGYIVTHHVKAIPNHSNALQLEVGSKYRMNQKKREQLAKDLAEVILIFMQHYLIEKAS